MTVASCRRDLRRFFLASLFVHLFFWVPLAVNEVPIQGDEAAYFSRALAFDSSIRSLASFESPTQLARETAYFGGVWPPLHPLVLSLGLLVFGKHVAVARLVVAILASLSTIATYLLADRISSRRTARVAAALHIAFAPFIGFSHLLYSETLYMLLISCSLYFYLRTTEAKPSRGALLPSIASGLFLGLAALTRAMALPAMIIMPVFLALETRDKRWRVLLPLTLLATSLATLAPWELALLRNEGIVIPISTSGAKMMFLGNNPKGMGAEGRAYIKQEIDEYVAQHSVHPQQAAQDLALKHILSDPMTALGSAHTRLLNTWRSESFVMTRALSAVYPPMRDAWIVAIWLSLLLSFLFVFSLGWAGLLLPSPPMRLRWMFVALIVLGMGPLLIGYGSTRHGLHFWGLLIISCAHALTNLRAERTRRRRIVALACASLAAIAILHQGGYYWASGLNQRRSHFYAGSASISSLDRIFASGTSLRDHLLFRSTGLASRGGISLSSLETRLVLSPGSGSQLVFSADELAKIAAVELRSPPGSGTPRLELRSESDDTHVVLDPIRREHWRRWTATGLPGVEFLWAAQSPHASDSPFAEKDRRAGLY